MKRNLQLHANHFAPTSPPPNNPGFNKNKFFPCIFRHTDADKNKMVSQHEFYKTITLFGATNCESDTSGMNIFDKVAGMDGVAQISLEDLQHEAVLHLDFFRCAFGPCGRCTVSASATGALEVESDQDDENENELGDDESSFLEAEAEEEDDGDDNDDDSFLEAETEEEDDGDDDDDDDSFLQ